MRLCLLVVALLSSPVLAQVRSDLGHIADSLRGIEGSISSAEHRRFLENATISDNSPYMQLRQLQIYAANLEQQNLQLQRELRDTKFKLDTNQAWLEALLKLIAKGDAAAASDKLSELAKLYTRRKVDVDLQVKAN